uniref:(northern house mosquito) hypothetical protein n=1 Tax=Culex pipiens TaxID=7175 RepID=A0A8D8L6A6_CULPI
MPLRVRSGTLTRRTWMRATQLTAPRPGASKRLATVSRPPSLPRLLQPTQKGRPLPRERRRLWLWLGPVAPSSNRPSATAYPTRTKPSASRCWTGSPHRRASEC